MRGRVPAQPAGKLGHFSHVALDSRFQERSYRVSLCGSGGCLGWRPRKAIGSNCEGEYWIAFEDVVGARVLGCLPRKATN